VVQVGAPDEILKNPANDYVRSFFRNVDITAIYTAGDIAHKKTVTVIEREGAGIAAALERLRSNDQDYGYVVTSDQHFRGVVSIESLLGAERQGGGISDAFIEATPLNRNTPLSELIGQTIVLPLRTARRRPVTRPIPGATQRAPELRKIPEAAPGVTARRHRTPPTAAVAGCRAASRYPRKALTSSSLSPMPGYHWVAGSRPD
jgi:hypothetical protein